MATDNNRIEPKAKVLKLAKYIILHFYFIYYKIKYYFFYLIMLIIMIVKCPKCHTKFKMPAAAIGLSGKLLQCGICQHKWHKQVTNSDIEQDKDIDSGDKNNSIFEDKTDGEENTYIANYHFDEIEKEQTGSLSIDKKFVAIVFLIFLVLSILFAIFSPKIIIKNFPATYPIYKFLNIEKNIFEYIPTIVKYKKNSDGEKILYIELKIKNITNSKQQFEPLKIALYNSEEKLLKEWEVPPLDGNIKAGEDRILKFGFKSPPKGGHDIVIKRDIKKIYNFSIKRSEAKNNPHNID